MSTLGEDSDQHRRWHWSSDQRCAAPLANAPL